jgi:TonB family protein
LRQDGSENVDLPTNLAPEFAETIQRCLNRDPAQRPAIAELLAQYKQAPPATLQSDVPPETNEPLVRTAATQNPSKTRALLTGIAIIIIALLVVWTAVRLIITHASVPHAASITPQSPPAVSRPAVVENPKPSAATSLPPVLHEEIPEISRIARETIRGVIKIAVRVSVDRSGNVVAATLNSHVSSKYFARAAMDAAKKWQFAPDADQPSRMWLLHFDLTRAGTTAHAAAL